MGLIGGLLWIFEEVAERVRDELENPEAIKAELAELNRQLEAGALSEEEFERREAPLVERLMQLE